MSRFSFSPPALLALLSLVFASCAMMHPGAPAATTVITSQDPDAVATAIIDVFTEHDFSIVSRNSDTVTVQRAASRSDEVIYGNWNDSKSFERVVIRYIPDHSGHFRLSCIPYTLRGSDGMEDISRRVGFFASEYNRLLKEVRNELGQKR